MSRPRQAAAEKPKSELSLSQPQSPQNPGSTAQLKQQRTDEVITAWVSTDLKTHNEIGSKGSFRVLQAAWVLQSWYYQPLGCSPLGGPQTAIRWVVEAVVATAK